MTSKEPSEGDVQALYMRLYRDAEDGGYHLNSDVNFTKDLVRGLLVNERRYGYPACPCRLSAGKKDDDQDIICPCDYRDQDVEEYDACYCGLYVSEDVFNGQKELGPVPERRLTPEERMKVEPEKLATIPTLSLPVWRCRVCGYLCARETPPAVCPICKAKKDRFERFI